MSLQTFVQLLFASLVAGVLGAALFFFLGWCLTRRELGSGWRHALRSMFQASAKSARAGDNEFDERVRALFEWRRLDSVLARRVALRRMLVFSKQPSIDLDRVEELWKGADEELNETLAVRDLRIESPAIPISTGEDIEIRLRSRWKSFGELHLVDSL